MVSTRTFGRFMAGAEEGAGGGHAAAALGRNLIDADTVLACAVKVLVEGEAGFCSGFQIVLRERMKVAPDSR